jgi:hypothetical protein
MAARAAVLCQWDAQRKRNVERSITVTYPGCIMYTL